MPNKDAFRSRSYMHVIHGRDMQRASVNQVNRERHKRASRR